MAKTLLEEMQGLGLTPTRFCWNSVISVHSRTGNTTGKTLHTHLHRAQGNPARGVGTAVHVGRACGCQAVLPWLPTLLRVVAMRLGNCRPRLE